jgi:hypothetical protein
VLLVGYMLGSRYWCLEIADNEIEITLCQCSRGTERDDSVGGRLLTGYISDNQRTECDLS